MKRILLVLAAALCALAAVLLVRAVQYGATPTVDVVQAGSADSAAFPPDSVVVSHLQAAVRIPTITYADSAVGIAHFQRLHMALASAFPLAFARLQREVMDSAGLLFTWPGSVPSLQPLVLMAHMDVVPVEAGTRWSHPPFSADIADGAVWGRGTLDDKLAVTGTLEAVESLLRAGYQPRRTMLLSYGYQEEGGGTSMSRLVERLRSRGVRPYLVLDEGGIVAEGLVPGARGRVALVATAEKRFVDLKLTARAAGGHSSAPPRETAVGVLAEALVKVEHSPMPARLDGATLEMLQTVGPTMPLNRRLVMANFWLFKPLLVAMMSRTPASNAAIRTTLAPTMLRGSPKDNVLPSTATAVVNVRLLPGDSPADVMAHVRSVVADPRVSVDTLGSFAAGTSVVAPTSGPAYRDLKLAIEQTFPGATVSPFLTIGATDARHFTRLTHNVYRFLPVTATPRDLERIHGTDERVLVSDYLRAVRFYRGLIERVTG